ncbi:hypothetical protein ABZ605_08500 [Streptomyces sp. NPDC012765]|uniref:hypothetical protein n=1 Tax=Streptomyces sp. NPDC012765 TaxID=3155249 RepID=UPI003402DC2C
MPRELPLLIFALLYLALYLVQYRASRALERQDPGLLPPVELPAADWPYDPGHGKHRRADGAPDAWLVCDALACAHLTRPHTRTPAGLVCDECGTTNAPGGPVHDDDYSEYADEVEQPTREEEKAAEIAHEVAAEERQMDQEAAADAFDAEDGECAAEFIDGSWHSDGCEDCEQRDAEDAL